MRPPLRSDIRPGSAECRQGRSPEDREWLLDRAWEAYRQQEIATIDLGKVDCDLRRKIIETEFLDQMKRG